MVRNRAVIKLRALWQIICWILWIQTLFYFNSRQKNSFIDIKFASEANFFLLIINRAFCFRPKIRTKSKSTLTLWWSKKVPTATFWLTTTVRPCFKLIQIASRHPRQTLPRAWWRRKEWDWCSSIRCSFRWPCEKDPINFVLPVQWPIRSTVPIPPLENQIWYGIHRNWHHQRTKWIHLSRNSKLQCQPWRRGRRGRKRKLRWDQCLKN